MIKTSIVGRIVNKIVNAEELAIENLSDNMIETEPSLTDRFLGAIDMTFKENGFNTQGYQIKTRTLRDRGAHSPEHEFGPDFISVLNVNIQNYLLSKGFLAQAKLAEKEEIKIKENGKHPEIQIVLPSDKSKKSRLVTQCEQMLSITPDSYVFVYSKNGIHVIPATTIVSIKSNSSSLGIYSKTIKQFYTDFLTSFIGDKKINASDDLTLRYQRDLTFSNSAMLINVGILPQKRPTPFSLLEI